MTAQSRRFRWGCLVAIGVFVLFIGIAALMVRGLMNSEYVSQLLRERISASSVCRVDWKNLRWQWKPSGTLAVCLEAIQVTPGVEAPSFFKSAGAKSFCLQVNARAFFLEKEIRVQKMDLDQPYLIARVQKNKDLEEMTREGASPLAEVSSHRSSDERSRTSSAQDFRMRWLVDSLRVREARVTVEGIAADPIVWDHLSGEVRPLGPGVDFTAQLEGGLLTGKDNFRVKAKGRWPLKDEAFLLNDVQVSLTGSTEFSRAAVKLFQEKVPPAMSLDFASLKLKGQGEGLSWTSEEQGKGSLSLTLQGVRGQWGTKPFDIVEMSLGENREEIVLKRFVLQPKEGVVAAEGKLDLQTTPLSWSLTFEAGGLPLQDFLPKGPEGSVQGVMSAQGRWTGKEIPTQEKSFWRTLEGTTRVSIKEGWLSINVLDAVMARLPILVPLRALAEESMPPRLRKVLTAEGAAWSLPEQTALWKNGRFVFDDLRIEFSDYRLRCPQLAFVPPSDIQGQAQIELSPSLSEEIVKKVESFGALENERGEVVIPLRPWQGPLAALKFLPDEKVLMKTVAVHEGRRQLSDLLKEVLGVEDSQTSPPPDPQGQDGSAESTDVPMDAPPPDRVDPLEKLLGDVLEEIVK